MLCYKGCVGEARRDVYYGLTSMTRRRAVCACGAGPTGGQAVVVVQHGVQEVGPPGLGPLGLGAAGPQRVGAVQPVLHDQHQEPPPGDGVPRQGGELGQRLDRELLQVLTLGAADGGGAVSIGDRVTVAGPIKRKW